MIPSLCRRAPAVVPVLLALVLNGCASTSRWQDLTAAELLELGREEFEAGEYGDAVETLERVLLGAPGFDGAAEAQLLLARAYFADEQFILAESEFSRFLDRFPAHADAAEAALGLCHANESLSPITQRDQAFTVQAVQVCQNVASDWRGTPAAEEAAGVADDMRSKLAQKQYEVGDHYLARGAPDAAILYWEELLEQFPDTDWAPTALAGIVEAYTRIGYDDEVDAAKRRLLENYPDSPEARTLAENGGAVPDGG